MTTVSTKSTNFFHLLIGVHCAKHALDFEPFPTNWFNRQSEPFDLHPTIVYGDKDVSLSLDDSKRLIRNFGQFMTTLLIDGKFFDEENLETLLRLIDRYCRTSDC